MKLFENYFFSGPSAGEEYLNGHFDLSFIFFSYLVASAASYVSLLLALRMWEAQSREYRWKLLIAGAGSLGGGIWSMHFIGTMAIHLPIEVTYDARLTLLSLIIVLIVSGYGLHRVSRVPLRKWDLIQGGIIMGIGISLMHYIGMEAMRLEARIQYRPGLFALSIIIAISAASAALILCLKCRKHPSGFWCPFRLFGALGMGIAIVGMHYSGMLAAVFIKTPVPLDKATVVLDSGLMALGIASILGIILYLSIITSNFNAKIGGKKRLSIIISIMAGSVLIVTSVGLNILYSASFEVQKTFLSENVKNKSFLLKAVLEKESRFQKDSSNEDLSRNLDGFFHGHRELLTFSTTGQLIVGILGKGNNQILFHDSNETSSSFFLNFSRVIREALKGKSGTLVANDENGNKLLIAYGPVPGFPVGVAVKMDMEEIGAPFRKAGKIASLCGLLVILVGAALFAGITNPMITRLEKEIQERKQAEDGLRKSERELANAQKIARLGNWALKLTDNELRWSDETYRIFGYHPGELDETYDAFLKGLHPEDRDLVLNSVNKSVQTREPYSIDHRIVWPDGTIRYVHEQSEVQLDDLNRPIQIVGTVQDITDRKQAEEQLKEVTVEKEKMETELKFATLVQEGFLPDEPPKIKGFEFAAKTVPARFIGGDFYDFLPLEGNRLGIFLGDVSGKGVSAALFMARLLSDFRYIAQSHRSPGKVMDNLNSILSERSRRGMFATAIYIILDLETKQLSFANAGHHPFFVTDSKGNIREEGHEGGTPLGIITGTTYQDFNTQLKPGDLTLIYTDGVTEPKNAANEYFGKERLGHLVAKHADGAPKIIETVRSHVMDFTRPSSPHDDLTLLAFKVL